ncbi:MAG: cytochrome P450 [Candidatus Binatia bacterium]
MTTLPPGPKLPALLQVLRWIRQPIPFMEDCVRRYGDCFTLRFPGYPPVVFFTDPEAVKEIFTGDPEQLRAGQANAVLESLLGPHSLLLLDGARHRRQRRLMMPPFHGERIQLYGAVMREITDRSIESWPLGRPFPIHSQMQGITLDVILRTVFGIDEGADLARLRDRLTHLLSIAAAHPLLQIPWLQIDLGPLTAWRRLMQVSREVDHILFAEFARRRATGHAGRTDVLTMLLEARDETGQPMSDAELRDEMITLLLAGHETTATSLAWVFHRILQHPDVLEKLRAELRQVIGSGPVTPQHLAKLEYLDATLKETQRLNPIIPLVGRRLQQPQRIGGRDLPAGAVAAPCIYLTHRRPDLWPDPERFAPERFLAKRPSPYEFFPFGGGVRHCLGAAFATYEMKIVIAQVLSRVALHAAPGYTVRIVHRTVTFAPSEGMPVVLDRRAA